MAELGDLVSVMLAMTNDDVKVKRLEALQAKLNEIEEALARDEKLLAEAHAAADQAAADRAECTAMLQRTEERSSALDQREAEMGRVLAAMNEEKAAFEAIRDTVEKEQSARRLDLETTAADLSQREKTIATRESEVAAEQVFARRMSLLATWKIDRLREAMAEIPPE
jgi:chromosome segregation ATPase